MKNIENYKNRYIACMILNFTWYEILKTSDNTEDGNSYKTSNLNRMLKK